MRQEWRSCWMYFATKAIWWFECVRPKWWRGWWPTGSSVEESASKCWSFSRRYLVTPCVTRRPSPSSYSSRHRKHPNSSGPKRWGPGFQLYSHFYYPFGILWNASLGLLKSFVKFPIEVLVKTLWPVSLYGTLHWDSFRILCLPLMFSVWKQGILVYDSH